MQEDDDQGRMIGIEQPPGRMPASQRFERALVHCRTPPISGLPEIGTIGCVHRQQPMYVAAARIEH